MKVYHQGGERTMIRLHLYRPKGRCPKCGHDEVGTVYHSFPQLHRCGFPFHQPGEGREHLCRSCFRCGHLWAEDCLAQEYSAIREADDG
jgi:hypothetical protein